MAKCLRNSLKHCGNTVVSDYCGHVKLLTYLEELDIEGNFVTMMNLLTEEDDHGYCSFAEFFSFCIRHQFTLRPWNAIEQQNFSFLKDIMHVSGATFVMVVDSEYDHLNGWIGRVLGFLNSGKFKVYFSFFQTCYTFLPNNLIGFPDSNE